MTGAASALIADIRFLRSPLQVIKKIAENQAAPENKPFLVMEVTCLSTSYVFCWSLPMHRSRLNHAFTSAQDDVHLQPK